MMELKQHGVSSSTTSLSTNTSSPATPYYQGEDDGAYTPSISRENMMLTPATTMTTPGLRQRRSTTALTTTTSALFSSSSNEISSAVTATALPPPRASTLVPSFIQRSAAVSTGATIATLDENKDDEKNNNTMIPYTLLQNDTELKQNQQRWVIVYGFTSSSSRRDIVKRFESFGIIERRVNGCTNWIALLYSTDLQADKAFCQNGTIVNTTTDGIIIVGVLRCTQLLANQLGLPNLLLSSSTIDRDDTNEKIDTKHLLLQDTHKKPNIVAEDDIFLLGTTTTAAGLTHSKSATRRKGIVESILSWFFMW